MADEEKTTWEMPEETAVQIVDKIRSFASDIRGDWTDPRSECREIWRLCDVLKERLKEPTKEIKQ